MPAVCEMLVCMISCAADPFRDLNRNSNPSASITPGTRATPGYFGRYTLTTRTRRGPTELPRVHASSSTLAGVLHTAICPETGNVAPALGEVSPEVCWESLLVTLRLTGRTHHAIRKDRIEAGCAQGTILMGSQCTGRSLGIIRIPGLALIFGLHCHC